MGRAERAVDGASPVVPGLGVRADGDRCVAVYPDRLDGPLQGGGVQVPGAVALRPLLLVQDEAERADQLEVGTARASRVTVSAACSAAAQALSSSRMSVVSVSMPHKY